MFNVNNNNNGTPSQNAWNQMELFNQLTLRNILNRQNDLGTPELRAAVASMSEEQKDDVLVFLECNTEELARLPNGRGIQAVANVRTLLDYLPIVGKLISPKNRLSSSYLTIIFDIPIFLLEILTCASNSVRWVQLDTPGLLKGVFKISPGDKTFSFEPRGSSNTTKSYKS